MDLEREQERNWHNSTRQEDPRGHIPPPQPNTTSPTMVDDPNLAVFTTPVDCVVVAASFFNKMKITGHPGCDTAVKLVNKALELQENMSTSSGKM